MQYPAKSLAIVSLFAFWILISSWPQSLHAEGFKLFGEGSAMAGGCSQHYRGGNEANATNLNDEDQRNYRCNLTAKVFCSNVNASDCSRYFGNKAPHANQNSIWNNLSANNVSDAFSELGSMRDKAGKCCGQGASNCQMEAVGRMPLMNGKEGISQTSEGDRDWARVAVLRSASVSASCRAFKAICLQEADKLNQWLAADSSHNCGENCNQESVEAVKNDCLRFDSSYADSNSREALRSHQEAGTMARETSAAPRESDKGESKTVNESGSSSQASPIGQVLNSLGQFAQAAMAQNQQQRDPFEGFDQQPPQDQGCGEGLTMISGVCTHVQRQMNLPRGSAAMIGSEVANRANSFGLTNPTDLNQNMASLDPRGGQMKSVATVRTIPPGGGASLGGGGNGSQAGGNPPGGGSRATNAAAILGAPEGASAISMVNAGLKMDASGGGGGGGNQSAGREEKINLQELFPSSLKSAQAARNVASLSAPQGEIHGRTTNIWSRITERFYIHCRQGLLRDCTP